jgi:phenylalanyl-tRNA synthetase beta chain
MVDPGWSVDEIAARLTMAGLEIESNDPAAPPFSGVVIADVVECARHPGADKLSVCTVSDGRESRRIVCGAPNVRAGLKVALATVGARLPGDVLIKRAKLRGVESAGMLCSSRELGLGDEHDGILEIESEAPAGSDLREALQLDDRILGVNLTPNRGDCLSVLGIARELAAASGAPLRPPADAPVAATVDDLLDVRLLAPEACPVFAGRVLRGVDSTARTPYWMQDRLRRAGLRSISPVVDVTNYVMLELGQPMHAYDLRRLNGGIDVRFARAGEALTLLDGRELPLGTDMLVIADADGPVGLAGIMGGEKSGVAGDTTDVFLEAAWFAPAAISGRARRVGLQTDASQRFERGVDPALASRALERASSLLVDICGARCGPAVATRAADHARGVTVVTLHKEHASRLLGLPVEPQETTALLSRLGMSLEDRGDHWDVTAPSYRFDIGIAQDLVEEIARLKGYDSVPPMDASSPARPGPASEASVSRERIALALVDRGYQEAITYSFVDPARQRLLFPERQSLPLANPIASDLAEMRVSLWPGLLAGLLENQRRQQERVRLFELGNVFDVSGNELRERFVVAGLAYGKAHPEQWGMASFALDFYDAKADVEGLLGLAGPLGEFVFEAGGPECLHPGRAATILRGGRPIGVIGELHPEISKRLEMKRSPFLFEIDVVDGFRTEPPKYSEISRFPAVRRDLAVVVDESVLLDLLKESVTVAAAGLLRELRIFDVYRGTGVETGRKSIALGLILQDASRTLTDTDADRVVAAVVMRLKSLHNATLRE